MNRTLRPGASFSPVATSTGSIATCSRRTWATETPMSRPRYPQPPASESTPEPVYRARRQLMGLGLASPLLALAGCAGADDAPPAAMPAVTDSPDGFRTSETLTTWQ